MERLSNDNGLSRWRKSSSKITQNIKPVLYLQLDGIKKSVAIIHNTIFCEICQIQLQSKENTSLFRLVI